MSRCNTFTLEEIECDICEKSVKNNPTAIRLHKKFCKNSNVTTDLVGQKKYGKSSMDNKSISNKLGLKCLVDKFIVEHKFL